MDFCLDLISACVKEATKEAMTYQRNKGTPIQPGRSEKKRSNVYASRDCKSPPQIFHNILSYPPSFKEANSSDYIGASLLGISILLIILMDYYVNFDSADLEFRERIWLAIKEHLPTNDLVRCTKAVAPI